MQVRSIEDGFQGSWHAGEIIGFEDGWREVKYLHLLHDNEVDFLTEAVEVSSSIDRTSTTSKKCDRGRIRPIPPTFGELAKENLNYGLCVDCWYHDAWWEGVVFDYKHGSSERKIFFPDLGDEISSDVTNLRLTHDWDEISGEWNYRGNWLFLEIIEEYERDRFIPVSLKQIWYDMRGRKESGDIGEWPFPVKDKLEDLVAQIIDENLRVTIDAFLKGCISSEAMSEFREALSGAVVPSADISLQDVDSTKQNDAAFTMIGELCKNAELAKDLQDSTPINNQVVPVQPKALSIICSDQNGLDVNMKPSAESQFSNKSKNDEKKQLRIKIKRNLQPDHSEMNIEPECCPQSMYDYAQHERPGNNLTTKVRGYLSFLGYKMEQVDKLKSVRYSSPGGGRTFYNLRQCIDYEKKQAENSSLAVEDIRSGKLLSPGSLKCTPPLKVSKTSKKGSQKGRRKVLNLNIEPRYCPEAVLKYVRSLKKRSSKTKDPLSKTRSELQDEARGHLSAIGWSFWPKLKQGVEEWRYDSPTSNKTYYSLLSACKAIVNGTELLSSGPMVDVQSENSKGNSVELSLSDKENHRRTISQRWAKIFPRALRKYKAGKVQRRKQNGFVNTMPSLLESGRAEQEVGDNGFAKRRSIRKLSTSFLSKEKKALGKVRTSSDSCNPSRVLRSSKRVQQAGTCKSSKAPRTVLSWLMDNGVVLGREKVQYYRQGDDKPIAAGRVTYNGISCSCCSNIFSLSGFEAHAGGYSLRPAANIYFTNDGKSLAERQLKMMSQKIKNIPREPLERSKGKRHKSWNDHICSLCHYGGKLLLCDRCPSSFHKECLHLQDKDIPEGNWFCPSCCCGLCGESYFDMNAESSTNKSVLFCHQCERQYHAHCVRERVEDKMDVHPTENWFCCKMCEKVHWGLQQLLGKPILVGHNNLTWTLIKPMNYLAYEHDDCDVAAITENYSKLGVALEVMHECFEPVKEPRTRRDLVEDVIFCRGSPLNRLNFRGFYTVLLERNDELITVAILRVYGDKVAEIPLIGTRFKHRRQGMCRIVMQELEKNLIELGVKRLVLPAAASVLNTWTTAFGFIPISDDERRDFLSYSFLDFQDTVMCQKLLRKLPSPLLLMSRDVSGVHHQTPRNVEGNSVIDDPEGNSPISEVSQEDQLEGELANDQYEESNGGDNGQDTPVAMVTDPTNLGGESCNSVEFKEQKIERDKCEGNLKFYTRKKAVELRSPVPQANCSKVEVSCR
uniref:PHD finger transcription factor n=1 Tax=Chenopodium quinoa TaxID=63459 RepID=A0A803KRG7_CHEQI